MMPGQKVHVGVYAISDVGRRWNIIVNSRFRRGEIYHAVGSKASEIASLSGAKDQIKLYCHICKSAAHDTGYLVFPAISTAIFADTDYSALHFTKNQFIATMYAGMYLGIFKYQCDPAQRTCCIILNNWFF
jgi:hypothetical protein